MVFLIDLDSAREVFTRWLPPWFELLDTLDQKGGRLKFLPQLRPYLKTNKHDSYPLFYERWPQIMSAARLAIEHTAPANLVFSDANISFATAQDRGRFFIQCLTELDELEPLVGPHLNEHDIAASEQMAQTIDPSDLEAIKPLLQSLPSLMMAMFYEYLSVAVHGLPLSTLIQRAKSGDDDAFGKAIQIDGSIQLVIPHFRERLAQAHLEADKDFLRMVANKIESPGYRGHLKHKSLWLVIGLLDLFGLLESMSGNEMLDFCNDVGANNSDAPIEDVKNMLKRVADYKRYQNSAPLSTP
jgi:hypothetical protein